MYDDLSTGFRDALTRGEELIVGDLSDRDALEAGRRPGDPASRVAQADRIGRLTGWQPRHADLRTIAADAWRWESRLVER